MAGIAADPELSKVFAQLTNADLYADLAYEVIGRLTTPVTVRKICGRELGALSEHRFGTRLSGIAGTGGGTGRSTWRGQDDDTGEAGAAARSHLAGKRTQILTLDTYRIAAADELQSYAAILGIGCEVLETTAALAQALEEHRNKDLILIDTPGLASADMDGFEEVAHLLSGHPKWTFTWYFRRRCEPLI